jgi:hypothetical protein
MLLYLEWPENCCPFVNMTELINRNDQPEGKAIHCRLNWVMDEPMLLLLFYYIWDEQIEGKTFAVSKSGGIYFSLKKEKPAFKIWLESGNWEFELNGRISIFSRLMGSKNAFEGPLLIRGKTGRKFVGDRARFQTELAEIKWQKGTRVKLGPFALPLSGINNIIFGVLKNSLARALDELLDKLVLSSNEISVDQLKKINEIANEWIPGPKIFTESLKIETGSPQNGRLPVFLEASFMGRDVGKSSVSVSSAHSPHLGSSESEIVIAYSQISKMLPTVVQKYPFLHFYVDCVDIKRKGNFLHISLNLTGNLSGALVVGIPLDPNHRPQPEKLFFEEIKLASGLRNSLFRFFQKQIRNRMRRDAQLQWQQWYDLLPVKPVWVSPELKGYKIGCYVTAEPQFIALADQLSVRFQLSLALGPSDKPLLPEVAERR